VRFIGPWNCGSLAGSIVRSGASASSGEARHPRELLSEPAYAGARDRAGPVVEALEKGPDAKRIAIAPADQLSAIVAYAVARILVSAWRTRI